MSISILSGQVLLMILIVLTGLLLQKLSILDEHTTKKICSLIMHAALPCTLLSSAATGGQDASGKDMLLCAAILLGYYAAAIIAMNVCCKAGKLDQQAKAITIIAVVFPNVAFIGLPLASALLGESTLIYNAISISIYNLLFFAYSPFLFGKNGRPKLRDMVTPINIATVVLVVMVAAGTRLPGLAHSFTKQIGQLSTPLALMVIGAMLGRSNIGKALKNRQLYIISALRLLVFPLAFAFATSFLPLPQTMWMTAMIGISCPAGSLVAVMALEKDSEALFASEAVVHTTVLSLLTMPLVLWLAGMM